jgi:EmrB/QacA subfamily drug resistance transporter
MRARDAAFTHSEILRILSGILLCMLLAALDQTVLATALPAIASDFKSVPHLSWAITAYLLASTLATLVFGKLSDLYGRRVLLETAIAVFLVASVACAMAPSMGALIAARALQGVGGGGLVSMTQAAIADVVSARERGRYQAYITTTFGTASIAGPLIGGLSVQYLTWRWAFWINVPIGILAYVLCRRGLKKLAAPGTRRPIDYLGGALLLPGVTALMIVIAWAGTEMSVTDPAFWLLATVAVIFLGGFVLQERRAPDALLPPRLFANPVVRVGLLLNATVTATMFGIFMLLPVFLQFVVGVGAGASGAMLVLPLVMQIAVSILTGWQLRRSGRYALLSRAGFASLAVAAALFTTMTAATPIWLIEIFMMFYGIGVGLCMAPLWVAVQNAADFRDLGAVTGANGFFRALAGAFGVTLLWSMLLFAFERAVAADGHAAWGAALLRGGRAALAALPPDQRAVVVPALAHGFGFAFGIAALFAAAGFCATWALKEIPLRTTIGQAGAPRDATGTAAD